MTLRPFSSARLALDRRPLAGQPSNTSFQFKNLQRVPPGLQLLNRYYFAQKMPRTRRRGPQGCRCAVETLRFPPHACWARLRQPADVPGLLGAGRPHLLRRPLPLEPGTLQPAHCQCTLTPLHSLLLALPPTFSDLLKLRSSRLRLILAFWASRLELHWPSPGPTEDVVPASAASTASTASTAP